MTNRQVSLFAAAGYTRRMNHDFGSGLIGHQTIAHLLGAWLKDPAPAYLFTGPAHVGKRTFAERLVRLLLGLKAEDEHWKSHPDLVLLEPEEGKTLVSVEQVRAARERLAMRPMVAPRLAAYVPYADRLNESGTNALLKILEEPAAGAVFVMVAEDLSRLPATVKSRSVILPFDIVPKDQIIEGLIARGLSREETEKLAPGARGRPGLALEPPAEQTGRGTVFAKNFLSATSIGQRLTEIEELSKACEASDDPASAWRDELMNAMQEAGRSFLAAPQSSLALGIALVAAVRSLSSAIPPRLPLEACAAYLSRPEASLARLFPSHLPSALPLIYNVQ